MPRILTSFREVSATMPPESADSARFDLPKFDLYGLVHKGLRGALCSLASRMSAHDPGDEQDLQMTLDDLEGVLYMCESHGAHEERSLHTAIELRRPGGAAFLNQTHAALEHDMLELRGLAAQLISTADASAQGVWRALYLKYCAFVGRNLVHMSDEEERAQALLDELYSVEELQSIQAKLLAGLGPEERLAFLRAMVRAVNKAQREQLLEFARAQLPAEVFASVQACCPS